MFPLLRKIPGVTAVVDLGAVDLTDFDFWIPALSSPRILNLEPQQISGQPYMECPPESYQKWRELTRSEKPKIALVWQGNESFAEDYLRSIDCEKFSKILAHSEFQFFSIRSGGDKNSLQHPNLRIMNEHIADPQDLAGLLRNMDLVISVDSGPAHLAGALGVPTLLLNRVMGWFTFGAEPDTTRPQESPWYDSMLILQQKHWGQWEEVLDRAEQILLSKQWPQGSVSMMDPIYHPDSPQPSSQLVELVETKHGPMMTVPNDYFVGKALDLYGEYSFGEEELFKKIIKPGDCVVEAGAHLGALTILFGKLTGPQGSVIAFEPQHFLCSVNRANMGLHNLRNVDVREEGLAEQERYIAAPTWDYSRVGNFGAVTLKDAKSSSNKKQVKLVTLDSLNLEKLDFMKIDIEGMEVSALLGAENTIQRCRPVLFVENDRPEQSEALVALLKKWNYQVEPFVTLLFNPQNFKGQSKNIYADAGSHNILAKPL
jgi:FkbM family methyltransferase